MQETVGIDEHLRLSAPRACRDRLPGSELQLHDDRSRDTHQLGRGHLRLPVTITIKMELSAASGNAVMAPALAAGLSFDTSYCTTLWSAGVSYPYASVEL